MQPLKDALAQNVNAAATLLALWAGSPVLQELF